MPALSSTHWIHGPIVSSSDLAAHVRLFETFGMTVSSRHELGTAECSAQWGTVGQAAVEVVMASAGTRYGARLLHFQPVSGEVIRDRARGYDADAPKVIDFYAPDFETACAVVKRAGYAIREPIAEYDMPEGHFVEAHVWGPDEVVCALIHGPAEFCWRFAVITDRMFSEPQSLSGPVSEFEASIAFFRQVLDFEVLYRYGIEDDSFRGLVGSAQPDFNLRAVNVGWTTEEPYLGLIHYGMRTDSYASLRGRARPPNRGTLGATIVVEDADAVANRVAAAGGTIIAGPGLGMAGDLGQVRFVTFTAPNGGCYQAVTPTG